MGSSRLALNFLQMDNGAGEIAVGQLHRHADVLEHAGDIYANNGDMEKAMEKWKEALKLAPENKVLIRKIKLKKYLRR